MNIIGPINATSGARYIVTAIDAYSQFGFARAKAEVKTIDCLDLLDDIVALHGTPEKLICDNGKQLKSNTWLKRCEELGVKPQYTNPYNPQANGMDERFDGMLVKIIRNYAHQHQYDWDKDLRWGVYVYNTTHQESIGHSPYEVIYGLKPRTPLNINASNSMSIEQSRDHIRKTVFFNNKVAKETQKRFYDRQRAKPQFYIGQPVLLKQHYIRSSQVSKFAYKWDGPAIVIKLPSHSDENEPWYAVVLDLKNSQCWSVPIQDMKPFHSRERTEDSEIAEAIADAQAITSNPSECEPYSCPEDIPDVYADCHPSAREDPPIQVINLDKSGYGTSTNKANHTQATRRKQSLPIIEPLESRKPKSRTRKHRQRRSKGG